MTKPDFRAVGFTDKANDFPRDEFAMVLLAAYNGVKPEQVPLAAHYFPNESTAKAWKRVADAARDYVKAEIEKEQAGDPV